MQKILLLSKHEPPPRYSLYQPKPRKFGKNIDDTIPEDTSPKLDKKRKKIVQQVIELGGTVVCPVALKRAPWVRIPTSTFHHLFSVSTS